jgi:hypothetical protein
MTNAQLLNDADLETVSGGASLIRTSTIVLPNIPRDLLTPQQIANLLSINSTFNPPVPPG